MFLLCISDMASSSPHRGRVELYLWGAAIGFGRSGHTTICCSLSWLETPGSYNPPAEAETPIGYYTAFFSPPPPHESRRRWPLR